MSALQVTSSYFSGWHYAERGVKILGRDKYLLVRVATSRGRSRVLDTTVRVLGSDDKRAFYAQWQDGEDLQGAVAHFSYVMQGETGVERRYCAELLEQMLKEEDPK